MKTTLTTLALIALPTAALAHPGHLADEGYGHSHYIALAILLSVAALGAGLLLRRVTRKRSKRADGAET